MNNCSQTKVPYYIINNLDFGERIFFTGTYDLNFRNTELNNNTVSADIVFNPVGFNIITADYIYVRENSIPSTTLLKENYTLISYNHRIMSKQLGQLTFQGFYPDTGTNGITESKLEIFNCFGIGIYNNVIKVIIDFSCEIRKIYFIGQVKNMPKYNPPNCC